MTAHVPAIARPGVLDRLRRLRARRRLGGGGPQDFVLMHMHQVPRVYLNTDRGVLALPLRQSCFYPDSLVFRYGARMTVATRVDSVSMRLGDREAVADGGPPLEFEAGEIVEWSWAPVGIEEEKGDTR